MHPYFLISQLGYAKSADVKQASTPQEQIHVNQTEATPSSDEKPTDELVIRTANPPPPKLPPPKEDLLPTWDQIDAPQTMLNPTSGLALSSDGKLCFKEFFGDRTVHPHVRRYGGRILMPDEKAQGPQIQCPQAKRSALIEQLKSASELPDGIE